MRPLSIKHIGHQTLKCRCYVDQIPLLRFLGSHSIQVIPHAMPIYIYSSGAYGGPNGQLTAKVRQQPESAARALG